MRRAGNVANMREIRIFLVGRAELRRPLRRCSCWWKGSTNTFIKEMVVEVPTEIIWLRMGSWKHERQVLKKDSAGWSWVTDESFCQKRIHVICYILQDTNWKPAISVGYYGSTIYLEDRGSTMVKVLCYKSEVRWFDHSWCQWIFHWHIIIPIALWPWGRLSL